MDTESRDTESLPARFIFSLFLNPCSYSISLIYAHSSHSTMSWSTKEAFSLPQLGCQHLQKWTFSFFLSADTAQCNSCTSRAHTWSKVLLGKPLLANLCSCQGPADSCVSSVSQTAIRKSFETFEIPILFLFFGRRAFSSVKFHSAIAQALACLSSLPPPDMLALCFWRAPVSTLVSPSQGLARSQSVPNEDSLSW